MQSQAIGVNMKLLQVIHFSQVQELADVPVHDLGSDEESLYEIPPTPKKPRMSTTADREIQSIGNELI